MATPRGKIGRLPEALRAEVNQMIRDNRTAAEIIDFLKGKGVDGILDVNISRWKTMGGYDRWERQQERIAQAVAKREWAAGIIQAAREGGQDGPTIISDAAALRGVELIADALDDLPDGHVASLLAAGDAKDFSGVLNALSRIRAGDQSAVRLQQQVDEYRRRLAQLAAVVDEKGSATKEDLAAIFKEGYGL